MDLVSLYVDQVGEGDLSREPRRAFPSMKIYPTIAEALTLGGSKLAVDGVVVVGEHGNYPRNEKGQTKYPRWRVLRADREGLQGQRPLRPDVQRQASLVELGLGANRCTTRRARWVSPFMAGSSLPVTWRIPSVEMPLGSRIREALCVCYGGVDSYDFHGLETIQCMVERRRGGGDGREMGAGLSRRQVLGRAEGRRLAAPSDGRGAVPQPHADAGAAGLQRHLSRPTTTCGGW